MRFGFAAEFGFAAQPGADPKVGVQNAALLSGDPDEGERGITSAKRIHIVGHGPDTRLRLVGDWEHKPIEGIQTAHGIERALDKLLREQVSRARANGCSWTEIGTALGTTKQSAWERFSDEE
jgi:hypothetical protein